MSRQTGNNDLDRPGHRRLSRFLHSCVLIDVERPRTSIIGWNQSSHSSSPQTQNSATMAYAPPPPRPLVPPAPSTSYRRPSIRQRRPFGRKSQLRPLSHPHPHPLRYSSIDEGPSFNYRMTVASADQLQVQAQLAQQAGPGRRRRPSVLRRSKQSAKARPPSYPLPSQPSTALSPCLHTVTSGVVLNDIPSVSPPQPRNPPAEPIGAAAKKHERRRTLSKVRSLIVNLVGGQRRPSVETYQEEAPVVNLDSPESFGAPLRPHRSPDAASFIVSSKITDMSELKPTRSSSPQRLSVQTVQSARSARSGHSLVGGILPSFRRRSLMRERLVSHFSTDSSDDDTSDDEDGTNAPLHSARSHIDVKMEDLQALPAKKDPAQASTSMIFGRRFSMPVMPRIKSMPEIVRHPLRHLSFQARGHSLDRITF